MLSRSVIENGQISHSAKLGVFTIVGRTEKAHTVRLYNYFLKKHVRVHPLSHAITLLQLS